MNLSAPKNTTFYVGAALGILALLGEYAGVSALAGNTFLFAILGWLALALGSFLKGL